MHVPGINNSYLVISHFAVLAQIQDFKRGRGNKGEGLHYEVTNTERIYPQDRSNFLQIS